MYTYIYVYIYPCKSVTGFRALTQTTSPQASLHGAVPPRNRSFLQVYVIKRSEAVCGGPRGSAGIPRASPGVPGASPRRPRGSLVEFRPSQGARGVSLGGSPGRPRGLGDPQRVPFRGPSLHFFFSIKLSKVVKFIIMEQS